MDFETCFRGIFRKLSIFFEISYQQMHVHVSKLCTQFLKGWSLVSAWYHFKHDFDQFNVSFTTLHYFDKDPQPNYLLAIGLTRWWYWSTSWHTQVELQLHTSSTASTLLKEPNWQSKQLLVSTLVKARIIDSKASVSIHCTFYFDFE